MTRVTRFVVVGALGFAVQVLAFYALAAGARWPLMPATIASVELATLHNFCWHARWTWSDRTGGSLTARFAAFHLTNGAMSLVGNAMVMALNAGWVHLPALAAVPLAVVSTSAANFALMSRWVFRPAALALIVCTAAPTASAATLQAETRAGWERYIARLEAAGPPPTRLTGQERYEALGGGLVVSRACLPFCSADDDVPSGTVQHWRGAVFVPEISVTALVSALKRAPTPQENVVRSRVLSRNGDDLHVYLRLARSAIVTVTYDTEHDVRFRYDRGGSATSRSVMTKVSEVADAGTDHERLRDPGDDRGFLWRLNVYTRYTPIQGGVLIEIESVTLSRDVPYLLRAMAAPVIDSIARESMVRSLEAIRHRFTAG